MAIYHLEAKVVSRSSGRSACAASAYMSCSRIYNDYDGVQHDYTRKKGLVWEQVFLPEHAPPEWHDREVMWNAVEAVEKSKDSRLAREFVVALPVELDVESWKELLTEYIQDQLVSKGMCVDTAIHDTDGHNPHAHILMTVRPLTDSGKWQNKTEKEYLCIRNGEELGFTASEFSTARHDGWEKQYPYMVDGKKEYLAPSVANRYGYERADKHPKSTRYGRQNPIAARWNSDMQLLAWRAAWADTVNRALERHGFEERIDHRSFKTRGITEQPTIHEGYIARDMEKHGLKADRCEINRQIREDNKLLRELKKQVQRLTVSVKETLPAVAEALETLRCNIIRIRYHLLDNISHRRDISDRIESAEIVLSEYKVVKSELRSRQDEKKDLVQQKNDTSIWKPIQLVRLNQQITELTEEIEELKSRKSQLMSELYCSTDQGIKEYEKYLEKLNGQLEKLEEQRDSLVAEIDEQTSKFNELKAQVDPDKEMDLTDERIMIRRKIHNQTIEGLKGSYGKQFDYARFNRAAEYADVKLNEDPEVFRIRMLDLQMKRARERSAARENAPKRSVHDLER